MNIDEAQLMAYVDGELDAAAAARIEAAMAMDPRLAARVQRQVALRAQLGAAYAGVLDEAVPVRLVDRVSGTAGGTAAGRPPASLRSRRPRWSAREWTALAASVLLGVLLARVLPLAPDTGPNGRLVDAAMLARGDLEQALDKRLAGDPDAARVVTGLSFRDRDGDYCRSFSVGKPRPLAGLACRDEAGWRVVALAETQVTSAGGLRQAASTLPASLLAEVDARIDGDPLDAEQERAARAAGWR
jgi:hypothetical protein